MLARHSFGAATRLASVRRFRTAAVRSAQDRAAAVPEEKDEGSIASVFSSLGGDAFVPLESRFLTLKKDLFSDALIESWRSVLAALEERTAEIREIGSEVRFGSLYASLLLLLTLYRRPFRKFRTRTFKPASPRN